MQLIIYYIPFVILVGLAISDLILGVANDAVNFTNSAIGSRVDPRWVILVVASIGILLGTVYSSGMLEIARKGIIYPQYFTFDHVIVIFLAVMFSDVILLNLFNTYGLPTSTSVSFVFELLGGAAAIGIIILLEAGSDLSQLAQFINSDRALLMISSIFISVLLAFMFGAIVQFITRLLFTFRIKNIIEQVWQFGQLSPLLLYSISF
jgi:phosphate/sulfate permease